MRLKIPSWVKYGVLAICLGYIVKIIVDLGPRQVWRAALHADPLYLVLGFLALAARFGVWSVKWFLIMRRKTHLSLSLLTRLVLAGNFLNLVTPTAKLGGGFFRAAVLKKKQGWPFFAAYGWVLTDQFSSFLGNIFLVGLSLTGAAFLFPASNWRVPMIAGGLLCLGVVLLWPFLRRPLWGWIQRSGSAERLRKWLPKKFRNLESKGGDRRDRRSRAEDLFEPLLCNGTARQIYLGDILLSALSYGLFCGSNALVLIGLGATAPVVSVTLAVMFGYLGGTALGILGGIGVTELFLIKLYTSAGISGEIATAGALLHRGIFYLFCLLVGGWAVWREGWQPADDPSEAA